MKILCVIDSFGSGGAQRQMVNLACGLKDKGHDVAFFVYYPNETFYRPLVEKAGIPVHEVTKGRGFSFKVLWRLIRLLRTNQFDGIISFLTTPNIYCELARLGSRCPRLIVSERSSSIGETSPIISVLRRLFHLSADCVVANSKTHAAWLRRLPWLRKKAYTIYNGYAISAPNPRKLKVRDGPLKYLVVGRVHPGKNGLRLIEALALFYRKHGTCPVVSWAGRREADADSCKYIEEMERMIELIPEIAANWHWLGERDDVPNLLASHDALLHQSLFEGLPNVVCEAFIYGCPVIASSVCDHPLLVKDGVRGLLCDPLSAHSICAAIERFEGLSTQERKQLGINTRKYADENLSIERMVRSYEDLLNGASKMPQKRY